MLANEKLDVYQCAIEFVATASQITEGLPRGNSAISDQLKRASLSVPLNIAEGSGKPAGDDRKRFYGIARGSAMECGAIMDVCRVLGVADASLIDKGKGLPLRIVSMLSKMCR